MNNYLLQIYFLREKVSCKLERENLEHGVSSMKVKTTTKTDRSFGWFSFAKTEIWLSELGQAMSR